MLTVEVTVCSTVWYSMYCTQQQPTVLYIKRVYLEKKSQAKWKVLPLWGAKNCQGWVWKNTKQPIKPTTFDPTSLEVDGEPFIVSVRAGLEEHVPSAVVPQLLPQPSAVEITEAELTNFISNDNCVEWEEETTAVEVNTIAIAKLRDAFLMSKGFDSSEAFDVTPCSEFQNFLKIDQDQAAMIFEKNKSHGNCDFWMEQRYGRITGSNFYRICHLKESTNEDNNLKDLLGYCPGPPEKQPVQFEWGIWKRNIRWIVYQIFLPMVLRLARARAPPLLPCIDMWPCLTMYCHVLPCIAQYYHLLYRHECFAGKCTTRKIHKNYIRDTSGLFSIISHMSLSLT